jgi:hypothetical protein
MPIQWLRVNLSVDQIRTQFAKAVGVNVDRSESGLLQVLPFAPVVIVPGRDPGGNMDLCTKRKHQNPNDRER